MIVAHPADEQLVAFGNGRLSGAAADTVHAHLETCADCRRRVSNLSADDFVDKLRGVVETHTSYGTDLYDGLSQAVRNLADLPTVERVPEELTGLTQYADLKELGRGGMGVVYLARHTLLDRPVVLKVASRALLAKAGRDAAERFLREMRSAAKLGHPNVVAAYDAFRHGDVLVFVMEYAHGEDLAKVLARKGRLPVPTACFYAHCVALGLQHAHQHGLVHRDIKPANLIQVKTGNKAVVKVLDFGLAKVSREAGGSGPTVTNMGMGTPQYMAPEQWKDAGGVDIRADIYSLGCTLFCLLTGRPPFRGSQFELMLAHCDTSAPAVSDLRPDAPAELTAAVAKMLAKNPADRYQTPTEVAAVLREFMKPGAKPLPVAAAEVPVSPPMRVVTEVQESAEVPAVAAPTATLAPRRRGRLWPMLVIGAVLNLVGGLMLYQVVFKTTDGTIVIDGVPADAAVELDGKTATVTRNGESVTLTAVKGPHALKVKQGGKELRVSGEAVVVVGGQEVRARVEPVLVVGSKEVRAKLEPPAKSATANAPAVPKLQDEIQEEVLPTILPLAPSAAGMTYRPRNSVPMFPTSARVSQFDFGTGERNGRGQAKFDRKGGSAVNIGPVPTDFAVEAVGRVRNGSTGSSWGLNVYTSEPNKQGFHVRLTNAGEVAVQNCLRDWQGGSRPIIKPVKHPAIRPGEADNTLLVVWRAQVLEVYVNGVAVLEPLSLGRAASPGRVAVGCHHNGGQGVVTAELDRLTVWSVEHLPPLVQAAPSRPALQNTPAPAQPPKPADPPGQGKATSSEAKQPAKPAGEPGSPVSPSEGFAAGTVWTGRAKQWDEKSPDDVSEYDCSLTITKRNGDRFEGRWERRYPDKVIGITLIKGAILGRTISWAAKDAVVVEGLPGFDLNGRLVGQELVLNSLDQPGKVKRRQTVILRLTPAESAKSGAALPTGRAVDGYTSLFNGKDRTGWNLVPDSKGKWEVSDGLLVNTGTSTVGAGPGMLESTRTDYRDLRLRVVAKRTGDAAAWVCVRSDVTADLKKGYATTLGGGKEPDGTVIPPGSITTLSGLPKGKRATWSKPAMDVGVAKGEWFTLEIEAVGNRLRTRVNGKPVAELTDPQSLFSTGKISLVGWANSAIAYKTIEVEEVK